MDKQESEMAEARFKQFEHVRKLAEHISSTELGFYISTAGLMGAQAKANMQGEHTKMLHSPSLSNLLAILFMVGSKLEEHYDYISANSLTRRP
jgi:hypothetical protein